MAFDTPREDYEIRCEDACRAMVRFMDNISEVSFEGSQADEWGEDRDDPCFYWSATMVLKTDVPNPRDGRTYRIPVHCQDDECNVEIGESDAPCGDTAQDVYRWMWIEQVVRPVPEGGK